MARDRGTCKLWVLSAESDVRHNTENAEIEATLSKEVGLLNWE